MSQLTRDERILLQVNELVAQGAPAGPSTWTRAAELVDTEERQPAPAAAPPARLRSWTTAEVLRAREQRVLSRHEARILLGLSRRGFWPWLKDSL